MGREIDLLFYSFTQSLVAPRVWPDPGRNQNLGRLGLWPNPLSPAGPRGSISVGILQKKYFFRETPCV